MDMENIKEILSKYHIFLIISIIILLVGISMILIQPPYSEDVVHFDKFSTILPTDAEYILTDDGVEITGPYPEYRAVITYSNSETKTYKEVYQEASNNGFIDWEENDDNYHIMMDASGGIKRDDFKYSYYDFIIPKKENAFNPDNVELNDSNANIVVVKGNDPDFTTQISRNLVIGG